MAIDNQTGMSMGSDSGILSEHESGQPKSKASVAPDVFMPTPAQEKTIKLAEAIFKRNKSHRSKFDKDWLEDYRMFRGDQWKHKRPAYRHSEVINLVFRTIQSTVPQMTDARPKFEYLAQEPADQAIADILNHLSTSDWDKYNWSDDLLEMIFDSHFYGSGFGSVTYDDKAADGLGAVVFESEDPFCLYPDPSARKINDDGRRSRDFVKAEPVDVDRLKKKYPKFAKYLKPDLSSFDLPDKEVRDDEDQTYLSPVSDKDLLVGSEKFSGHTERKQALEITVYLKDDTVVTKKEINEEGTAEVEVKRLKYPNGRKIVLVNRIPVLDEEIEFDDKKFPFIKVNNYVAPREFYGISEIEQIKGPQRIFNKLVSFALDVLTLMGNPIWVVDTDSNVDTDQLFNKPGLIVEKSKGSEVRRETGVQLQPYVIQMINQFQSWIDDVSGSKDVSRGAADGVTAARAIEALQEAANTRVRQKTRLLDRTLQDFGQMYAARVFQFYKAPRVFRLTADDNTEQYFKVSIDGGTVRFNGFDETGKPKEMRELEMVRDFDVRVTTGSTLTIAKRDHFNKAVSLFDRQAITAEDLLESAEWPNIPKTMQRMEEQQAKAMEAQAMQEAQGQAPA